MWVIVEEINFKELIILLGGIGTDKLSECETVEMLQLSKRFNFRVYWHNLTILQ